MSHHYYDYFHGTRHPYLGWPETMRKPENLPWSMGRLGLDVELLNSQRPSAAESLSLSLDIEEMLSYSWLSSLVSAVETMDPFPGLPPFWRTPSKRRDR